MIKPRSGQTGEGVNNADNLFVFIYNDEGVNRIMIHRLTGLHNLRVLIDRLRVTGHDLIHLRIEKCLPETLHCPTDIAICDDSDQGRIYDF